MLPCISAKHLKGEWEPHFCYHSTACAEGTRELDTAAAGEQQRVRLRLREILQCCINAEQMQPDECHLHPQGRGALSTHHPPGREVGRSQ